MKNINKISITGILILAIIVVILIVVVIGQGREIDDLKQVDESNTQEPENEIEKPGKDEEIIDKSKDIKNLKATITLGRLDIIEGDGFSVIDGNDAEYNFYLEGNTYVIEGSKTKENEIVLTVPKDIVLDSLDLKVIGGALFVNDIKTDKLLTECDGGTLQYTGNIENSGDIDHKHGETIIKLEGAESDFNYELEYDRGHISIANKNYAGLRGTDAIDNKADKDIKIKSSMGSVNISF